jgi:4-amino-4-deoxy-L-arabinose transferase-like glycosyltransferase
VGARILRALRARLPELLLLVFGVALRVSMTRTFKVEWGFDFESHWKYVEWFKSHWSLPDFNWSRATYHPPLFYLLAGAALRFHVSQQSIGLLSIGAGCLRLGFIALALDRYLPSQRLARQVALALAAVLPASLHIDAMVNCEALLGLFAAIALFLLPLAFSPTVRDRYVWAPMLGCALGLGLLTKVSMLGVLGAAGLAALLELGFTRAPLRARLQQLAPLVLGLAVTGIVAGWFFVHNARAYGKPFVTAFDGREAYTMVEMNKVPYFQRRSFSFLAGWSSDIYRSPYWPSGTQPTSHLFPVLIATTFVDFFKMHFAPVDRTIYSATRGPPNPTAFALSRLSAAGGTWIAFFTFLAWLATTRAVWRRREFGLLAILLVPLATLIAQTDMAIRYPIDWLGPVKGAYFQFASPPLCALYGVAVEWMWRRSWPGRIVAGLSLFAFALVAAYSLYCRL